MNKIKKNWYCLLSILIVLVALLIRTVGLDKLPPSLYWEEVALGYDAYSISQTADDHHGNFLPIVAFESFGDWKPALYFYAIVPFIKLLGLNAWSVRLPSALGGVMIVIGIRELVNILLKDHYQKKQLKMISLLAMLVTTFSPWAIQFSRAGWEVNLATSLVLWGVILLLQFIESSKLNYKFPFGVLLLILSMYTYHATRIIAPLLGMTILLFYLFNFKNLAQLKKQVILDYKIWLVTILVGLMTLPLLLSMTDPTVSQRFAETSIFSNLSVIEKSNQLKELAGNSIFARIIYHRYLLFAREIVANFVSHFTANFLFISGDINPRHSIQYMGLFYHVEALFLLWGAISIWLKKNHKSALLLTFWLVIGIMPASISLASPHALRILPTLPVWIVLIAIGIFESLQFVRDWLAHFYPKLKTFILYILIGGLVAVYLIEVVMWARFYTKIYPKVYASEWQYGYEQMIEELSAVRAIREELVVNIVRTQGRPAMYYWFYSKTDPRLVQRAETSAKKDQGEFLEFENFNFINGLGEIKGKNPLLVLSSKESIPQGVGYQLYKEVRDPMGRVVWRIYQIENN